MGPLGDAGRPPDEVLRPGAPVTATITRSRSLPGLGDPVPLAVVLEGVVDPVGDPEESQLPQCAEVADAEVVAEGGVDPVRRVDVAVGHAPAQGLRGHVDQLDLFGAAHDMVGDGLSLAHARDALHDVVQGLEVLDVDGGDDVDAGRRAARRRPATASRCGCRGRSCGPARRRGRPRGAARAPRRGPSPRTRRLDGSIRRRGTTSRSPICSAVFARRWVTAMPITTSGPRSRRRRPSLSMA